MSQAIETYGHLTNGGKRCVELTQEEECVLLYAYDHGVSMLTAPEKKTLDSVIAKLKDQIWP